MKRLTLTAVLLLVSTTLLAQAPIPRALKDAKTVYLINDGAKKDLFNDLAIELQKWGRWTLVDNVADSDLTLTIGGLKMYRGWPITIVDSHDKTPLYSDKQKKPGLRASAAVALVKELRKEIEGESKK